MSFIGKTYTIPPYVFSLDGAKVTILEVMKLGIDEKNYLYLVSCYIECRGYRSKVFNLTVRNNAELIEKLRTEIAKMKLLIMTGQTHLFQKI